MKIGMHPLSILQFRKIFSRMSFWLLIPVMTLPGLLNAQAVPDRVTITARGPLQVSEVLVRQGESVVAGDTLAVMKRADGSKLTIRAGVSGSITEWKLKPYRSFKDGEMLGVLQVKPLIIETSGTASPEFKEPHLQVMFQELQDSTGLARMIRGQEMDWSEGIGRVVMMLVGLVLLFLGIQKKFEPLLLVPIGFGALLTNIPGAGMSEPGGLLYYVYEMGITTGIFPLLIFMGIGAMTDFGPMLANPRTALLGGAAQFGIFATLLGALALNWIPGIDFSLRDAASIGIIGGADGPTAIFLSSQLSPRLLGSIAIAAYSYMALVPLIQPPIMKLLTTESERQMEMQQLRYVSRREKIIFPLLVLILCALLLPSAAPLIGMFMFGNLARECGVIERLSSTMQNALINTVTIFLGLGVGSKLLATRFLNLETVGILILGVIAFSIGTASGVLLAKLMNRMSSMSINPLIGAAGVSAVPMAARVVNHVGLEANPQNHLIMHAMGPNVSGVIGSAVAAGVLLSML
jgi:oxaloacetate decarboxylase beta subunit|tara:strand:+ start:13249 stop:14808 length:1560 start_codon:yes stop_codon:yes gene_type:complete